MCGLIGGYTPQVAAQLSLLHHRGPDASGCVQRGALWLGHTRLAIVDCDERSNQPMQRGDVTAIYNGELWNYQPLRAELERLAWTFTTMGDTEVVVTALAQWGAEALSKFNGMFALAWTSTGEEVWLATDRYGEVPLHVARHVPAVFASELHVLRALGAPLASCLQISPGTLYTLRQASGQAQRYYTPDLTPLRVARAEAAAVLRQHLLNACTERAMADVPVCTLLSGGIDSAAIAAGLVRVLPSLVAYTAVLNPRARDLQAARTVAKALDIELREVIVPIPRPCDLGAVIAMIEMPHKAQVEIGWACWCLAQQMQRDGMKVTFSGEGSDELWASYGFAYHALKTQHWHTYRARLFNDQHRKNFARCNKIFLRAGVECRLPFLHPPFVEYALRLPQSVVQDGKSRPKAVLQDAMDGLVPAAVCQRPKVAFQDGIGLKQAIAAVLPSPERFYHAEYHRHFAAGGEFPRPSPRHTLGI